MSFDLQTYRQRIAQLAAEDVFIGTSSWKYAGWCGQIYDEQRYLTRNKFSEAKFERECLSEYAQTFSTVCVDAGYKKARPDWHDELIASLSNGPVHTPSNYHNS